MGHGEAKAPQPLAKLAKRGDMSSVEWVLVVGFFSIGFLLYLIHRELAALRMEFRQVAAFLSNARYRSD